MRQIMKKREYEEYYEETTNYKKVSTKNLYNGLFNIIININTFFFVYFNRNLKILIESIIILLHLFST